MRSAAVLLILLADVLALPAQTAAPEPAPSLTEEQIRQLIREAAEKDIENVKAARNYTYVQREEEHKLNSKGEIELTETRTYEIMVLFEEPVRKQIAKDDKLLPEKDAKKEEEKIQKIIDKRKNESEGDRNKRLEKQEKNRVKDREFVKEIADAYNFRLTGSETIDDHDTFVIDADPRPGFEPRTKDGGMLPHFRFRTWIDKVEKQWIKLDVQCIDTVSVGLFLIRLHNGSNIQIEQIRVNEEVWLPKHVTLKLDARVLLLKGMSIQEDVTFRDYRKFRSATKIVPGEEVQEVE